METEGRKAALTLFLAGIAMGLVCRLSVLFPYESLWSLPSAGVLVGVPAVCAAALMFRSPSEKGAYFDAFLYMAGCAAAYFGTKVLFTLLRPSIRLEGCSVMRLAVCMVLPAVFGAAGYVISKRNAGQGFGVFVCALVPAVLLAEGIGCLTVLADRGRLLFQTLFDLAFCVRFGSVSFRQVNRKGLFLFSVAAVGALLFFTVFRPCMRKM